jgi:hypothetical protein
MLKFLTPLVFVFLMMGLVNTPSPDGYATNSNLEMSSGSLMLAGHCNGDHGDDDHGDEGETEEGESSNTGTTSTS